MKIGKIPIFLLKSGGNDVKVLKQNEKRGPPNRSEFGNSLHKPTKHTVCQNGSAKPTRRCIPIYPGSVAGGSSLPSSYFYDFTATYVRSGYRYIHADTRKNL